MAYCYPDPLEKNPNMENTKREFAYRSNGVAIDQGSVQQKLHAIKELFPDIDIHGDNALTFQGRTGSMEVFTAQVKKDLGHALEAVITGGADK